MDERSKPVEGKGAIGGLVVFDISLSQSGTKGRRGHEEEKKSLLINDWGHDRPMQSK